MKTAGKLHSKDCTRYDCICKGIDKSTSGKKKEVSLLGYIRKDWVMKHCRANAMIPLLFPDDKVWYDMQYVPSVKVCITIKEI